MGTAVPHAPIMKRGGLHGHRRFCDELNERMHPDNPYRRIPVDFAGLKAAFPEGVGKYITEIAPGRFRLNWEDADALRLLTAALLRRDFALEWNLPAGRLVPPVPNRVNYVCWVNELLREAGENSEGGSGAVADVSAVTGMDIGTGASCIYPLIGTRMSPHWRRIIATDIDPEAVASAMQNVVVNGLQERIEVRLVPYTEDPNIGPLLSAYRPDTDGQLHFVMCNPPFFASFEEMNQGRSAPEEGGKLLPPNAACPNNPLEVVTPGGELLFVSKMVRDSTHLAHGVLWFSSMLGKASSVKAIENQLSHIPSVTAIRTTRFFQGRTVRWGIAWSFVPGLRRRLPKAPHDRSHSFVVVPAANLPLDTAGVTAAANEIAARVGQYLRDNGMELYHLDPAQRAEQQGGAAAGGGGVKESSTHDDSMHEGDDTADIAIDVYAVKLVAPPPSKNSDSSAAAAVPPQQQQRQQLDRLLVRAAVMRKEEGLVVELEAQAVSGPTAIEFDRLSATADGEICRTNRRWRRKLQREAGGK